MATCPSCGSTTSEGAIFCDQCGMRLAQPEAAAPEAAPAPASGGIICPACGAGNVPGEAFCDYCGSRLEAPEPQSVPELEPVSSEAELEVAPAPAAPPAAPPAEEPAAAPAEVPACPACGAAAVAGEAFCADCGASLAPAPPTPEPVAEPEPAAAPEPVVEDVPTEPEPEPEPVSVPTPSPIALPVCPACGAEVEFGDAYCSACGSSLQAAPDTTAPAETPVSPGVAGPRLVVVDSGAEIPLPAGDEILVGREDPVSGIFPNIDLTPHGGEEGGVSRRHARIILEGTGYSVEDLNSTNYTFVNKQKLTPKVRQPLADGDQIRFGRVAVVFRTES